MPRVDYHLQFLQLAQRRWGLWRGLESMGIGAAAGAIAGGFIVGVLAWREEPALVPALVLLAVGMLVGVAFGAARRPTLAQTAARADQHLKLHDLLTTAIMPQQFGDSAFQQIVIGQANMV